ncbi:hypothetical protein BDQ12DRAFT_465898 [Crucibulum laeve]|uniref:C3H1-type domain-containing protein n=1 Tax=Crucibulum laeve TaxID=68775 RepID=A0A5C3MAC7_9AGAR|nr:hypothetical protein BDQ12DRAFT_465898 [Crucibulum laeve]
MSQPFKKSHKKRHTKPCKYFQSRGCPLSADVCDFAHVVAVPAVAPVIPCRFYKFNQCTVGPSCRFSHGSIASSLESPNAHDAGIPSSVHSMDSRYMDSPPFYASYSPYYPGWSPMSDLSPTSAGTSSPSFAPPYNAFAPILPARSRNSSNSSGTLSVDSSDFFVYTEDPQYAEHGHSHQSQIRIYERSPILHVPPRWPSLDTGAALINSTSEALDSPATESGKSVSSSPTISRPRGYSRSALRHKESKYKTKPCKYYWTEEGHRSVEGCPTGEKCTFVHDEPLPPEQSSPRSKAPKSPSSSEDSPKKNYFPISWRVIGGGVRVGGKQSDAGSDLEDKEGSSDHDVPQENSPPDLSSFRDALPQVFRDKDSAVPSYKPIKRARSSSIPPTPSTVPVRVDSLFSAESPGVL